MHVREFLKASTVCIYKCLIGSVKKVELAGGDPCFRKFSNCIIVNAQPYERRSTVDIQACKNLCLASNTGVFQVRRLPLPSLT